MKSFREYLAEAKIDKAEPEENDNINESSDKVLEELLNDVKNLYTKFNKAEQKIKIFSQSKLTEIQVKIIDTLEK